MPPPVRSTRLTRSRRRRDQQAQGILEYTLTIAVIAVVVVVLLQQIGSLGKADLCKVDNGLSTANALNPATGCTITQSSYSIGVGTAPYGLAQGPDGALWFTESGADAIGRMTLSGTITNTYSCAAAGCTSPWFITAGPDGNMWFTDGNSSGGGSDKVYVMSMSGTIVQTYAMPSSHTPEGIVIGPNNNIWVSEWGFPDIAQITGGTVYEYATGVPLSGIPALGPDGDLYLVYYNGNKIFRAVPTGATTATIQSCTVSNSASNPNPNGIAVGGDGAMWIVDYTTHDVGRITTAQFTANVGGTCGETDWSADLAITALTSGEGDNTGIWFAELGGTKIGRFDTSTDSLSEISMAGGGLPRQMIVASDGALWLTNSSTNSILRFSGAG